MADRPLIFSAPMVRALLAGRKTQTRRLLKPQPETFTVEDGRECDVALTHVEGDAWPRIATGRVITRQQVRWRPGDRVWVREAFMPLPEEVAQDPPRPSKWTIVYGAGGADAERTAPAAYDPTLYNYERWSSPIHMPRWASRITLEITDVRVQQLLDISEEDARDEGFADGPLGDPMPERDIGGGLTISSPGGWASAAAHYQVYWQQIHPDWDGFSSPWVVALTFRAAAKNIDALPGAGR